MTMADTRTAGVAERDHRRTTVRGWVTVTTIVLLGYEQFTNHEFG